MRMARGRSPEQTDESESMDNLPSKERGGLARAHVAVKLSDERRSG